MIADLPNTAKPEAPDAARATDYLTTLVATGRLAVAAILPSGQISGRTFTLPAERDGLQAWIVERIESANLYLTLNEPIETERQIGRGGRVAAADIQSIRGIIVDLDPDKVAEQLPGGFEAERARLRGVVDLLQSHFICEPAAVVDTGGGYQLTYLFPEPLPATPENVAGVVAQARGLAQAFGGDATHDVSHLFRIPHTRNLPNTVKRVRGRMEAVTVLVDIPMARVSLDVLPCLAPPVAASAPAEAASAFDCGDAIAFFGAPEDLPEELKTKVSAAVESSALLRNAMDAERFQDRSAQDYALAAALREAGCFTQPEAACVLAAYGSDKIEERRENYLTATLEKAWAATAPRKTGADHFDGEAAVTPLSTEAAGIEWLEPARWQGREPPPRLWEVEGLIPRGEVTLLYGEGGIGKTLLAHQYATAAATGQRFLGQVTRPARVLCFFCEDSVDELERRQGDINRHLGVRHADLDNLRIAARRTMDNLLVLWNRSDGKMQHQAIWHKLREDVLAFRADVVILDTLADIYGGSEIDRAQVSGFMKACLGKLAQDTGCSVLVLGHPSQAGQQSGKGTSGSTAWSNTARSRLYLRYPDGTDRGNIRELEGMKANYGPKGNTFKLRWARGAFEAIAASVAAGPEVIAALPRSEDAAEHKVLLALLAHQGERLVLANNSPYCAPRVLKRLEPEELAAFSEKEILEALHRLFARKLVREDLVGRDGSRRKFKGLVIVADNLSASGKAENVESASETYAEVHQSAGGTAAMSGADAAMLPLSH